MSAQPSAPAAPPDMVNIEIDGKPMQVPKNSMIIAAAEIVEFADQAGSDVTAEIIELN